MPSPLPPQKSELLFVSGVSGEEGGKGGKGGQGGAAGPGGFQGSLEENDQELRKGTKQVRFKKIERSKSCQTNFFSFSTVSESFYHKNVQVKQFVMLV